MLVIQLLMVVQQMLLTNIRIFALQSLMLAGIAAIVASVHHANEVYLVAVLTLLGKVLLLPRLLTRLVRRIQIIQEIEPMLNSTASMLLCGGLTLLGYIVARPFTSLERLGNNTLGIAITLLLTGFFLMIHRRKAITQVLALLTIENGVMLAAVALTSYGMPLVVELGIFFAVMVSVKLLVPILLAPTLAGLLCLRVRSLRVMELANIVAFAATVALGVQLLGRVLAPPHVVTELQEFFRADALSAWMVLLISAVSLGSSLYAGRYFRRDLAAGVVTPARAKHFFVLTPIFATGMFLVVLANNLGVMWFALEATALSSVLLVALYNRNTSLEAAWKYIMLGSLGLALALFGTVFTYAAAVDKNSTTLPSFNWSHLMQTAGQLDHRMIKLAFVFVLVGYGTKAGLAPMHTWLPDAHSEAPSPTSAMLSGVSLKVALYALLRFHILTTQCLGSPFSRTLLLVFGLASMCLAAPFILVQTNLKRLLAYSSLEHI